MRAALRRLADTGTRAKASKRLYSHVRFHPTLQLDFLPKYLDPRIQSDAPFMDLTFLGSSAQCSTAVRGVCSALLRTRQKSYLIDAGDGVCRQLQRADLSTPVDTICITHLHGDHIWGLAPVVRQVAGVARDAALQVCGPPGLYAFLVTAFRISGMTEVPDGARVEVYEMVNRGGPDAWDMQKRPLLYMDSRTGEGHVEGLVQRFLEPDEDGYWTIPCPPETQQRRGKAALGHSKTKMRAGRVKHIKDSFGYVAIEQPRRLIDSAMCKKLGLPPSQKYYKLLIGETVTTDAGRVISPEEVCREVPGRKLAYVGDSCDPRAMATLIEGADVLVHEATFLDKSRKEAIEKGHSTSGMAGDFARRLNVGALFMNHFAPHNFKNGYRYAVTTSREEARGSSGAEGPLPVIVAEDFMHVKLSGNKVVDVHGSQWLASLLRTSPDEPHIEVLGHRHAEPMANGRKVKSRANATGAKALEASRK